MERHVEIDDDVFEQLFKDCTLDPAIFTHEAHLRLAWIHISKYGVDKAIINITDQLEAYTRFLGARDKFNVTLTVAAIKAVEHFMNRTSLQDFEHLIGEFPRLKYNFRGLMHAHYSIDIFTAPVAKTVFLQPDLLPFD